MDEKNNSRQSRSRADEHSWRTLLVAVLAFANNFSGLFSKMQSGLRGGMRRLLSLVLRLLLLVFLALLGVVFVLIGVAEMLTEAFNLDGGAAYVLVGALVLILSLLFLAVSRK
jgi:hypothetical protein